MDNTTTTSSSCLININSSSPAATVDVEYDYDDYTDGTFGPCLYGRHGSYFLPVLYYVFFAAGLLGNALVLWVIAFGVRLRSMSDVCLLNLAVADLLLVCSLPFLAHQAWDQQWRFGEAACKAVLGAYHVGFYGGIFFVLLMSVDRYLAVVSAVHVLRARTRSLGVAAAAVAWLAGLLASFPELAFLRVQEAETSSTSESGKILFCAPQFTAEDAMATARHENSHFWAVFGLFKMNVLGLLIPTAVMVFCYSRIVRKLLRNGHSANKRQSVRLVLAVVAAFLCCWTPYNVAALFKALELLRVYTGCESSKAIRVALQVTEAVAYSHSCLNPVLYVFVGRKFRGHLVRLVHGAPCWPCQVTGTLASLDRVTACAVQQQQQPASAEDERSTAF